MKEARAFAEMRKPIKNWLSYWKRHQCYEVKVSRGFLVLVFIAPDPSWDRKKRSLSLEKYIQCIEIYVCWPYVDRDILKEEIRGGGEEGPQCLTIRCPCCQANGRSNRLLFKLDLSENYILGPDRPPNEHYDDSAETVRERKNVPDYLKSAVGMSDLRQRHIAEECKIFKRYQLPLVGIERRCRSCRNYFRIMVYLCPRTAWEQKRLLEKEGPALLKSVSPQLNRITANTTGQ